MVGWIGLMRWMRRCSIRHSTASRRQSGTERFMDTESTTVRCVSVSASGQRVGGASYSPLFLHQAQHCSTHMEQPVRSSTYTLLTPQSLNSEVAGYSYTYFIQIVGVYNGLEGFQTKQFKETVPLIDGYYEIYIQFLRFPP